MPLTTVNGAGLYYEEIGTGPSLVFLHGLGSSGLDWEEQVTAFSDQYRVITIDLRGHGRSEKPAGPYTMALFASDVASLLKDIGAIPAHVVGLSLGGMVTMELAVSHPETVASITVVNTGPSVIPQTIKDRMFIWQRHLLLRLFSMEKLGGVLAGRLLPGEDLGDKRSTFVERFKENDKAAYKATFDAITSWSAIERLESVSCPVLVIAADEDYSPVEAKQIIVDTVPDGRITVIEDCRHATPMERPEAFNRALGEFLTDIT
jgi:3-oxoadipate enol-lactonase